jgi:hypothetical protein
VANPFLCLRMEIQSIFLARSHLRWLETFASSVHLDVLSLVLKYEEDVEYKLSEHPKEANSRGKTLSPFPDDTQLISDIHIAVASTHTTTSADSFGEENKKSAICRESIVMRQKTKDGTDIVGRYRDSESGHGVLWENEHHFFLSFQGR